MVMRTVIGKSGEEKVVDLLKEIQRKASESATRPPGDKVLDDHEDFYWGKYDGGENSLRELDLDLDSAKLRIEEAEQALAETQTRVDDAVGYVDEVRGELEGIDWDNLGSSVSTSGPPPANPTVGQTLWVSPTGRVFRAIECEEHA